MKKESFLYQKVRGIFNKHVDEGAPRKLIETNMCREFRLCRDDVRRLIEEMHLENEMLLRRKRVKRESGASYTAAKDQEGYLEDLRVSR